MANEVDHLTRSRWAVRVRPGKIATCNRDGYATAWTDFVTPDGEVFLLGPTALCGEHASLLEQFMVEVRYPDGRVVRSREPGQPLQPRLG